MKSEHLKQVQRFLDLGVTEREAKVYIELLSKKQFTSSELQKSAGIPRTKIYEVLLKMINRGICNERRLGKVKYYEAVEPKKAFQKVLEDYKNNYQYELEKKNKIADDLAKTFHRVYEKNKNLESPLEYVEVIKDKERAQKKILEAFQNSKSEALFLIKGPYICDTSNRLKEQITEEKRMLKRGVTCKKVYEFKELHDEEFIIDQFKPLAKLGSKLRVTDSIPVKMVVFDENLVLFPLQDIILNPVELTIICVEHKEMVSACKILFNFMWSNAKPLKV